MNPLISVIVPCYNQAQFLPEALQSVLEQTYTHWECIIVNDGSPDNTHEVAQEWLAKDKRFKYIQKVNGGLSSARNAGLDLAVGDYIQFLDCDDILIETKLNDSIKLVLPNEAIIVSDFASFINSKPINLIAPYCKLSQQLLNFESILYQWDITFTIPIHCGFFPKSIFKTIHFNEKLKAKEDWLFWIEIAQKNSTFVFLDKTLALYRKHTVSMTTDRAHMFSNRILLFEILDNYVPQQVYKRFLLNRLEGNYVKISNLNKDKSDFKKSNTYQFGSLCKKTIKKIGLLPTAKKIFEFINPLKV